MKCQNKNFTSQINCIKVSGSRLYVSEASDSIRVMKYRPVDSQLYSFADDVIPRWMTKFILLDEDTVAGADKFENMFILRLPQGAEEDAEDDPMDTKANWEIGNMNASQYKLDQICQFHTGEVITQL